LLLEIELYQELIYPWMIVREIYKSLGLVHRGTFIRKIHNKRMPLLNSPKNQAGLKSNTMHYEYIVVMEKE